MEVAPPHASPEIGRRALGILWKKRWTVALGAAIAVGMIFRLIWLLPTCADQHAFAQSRLPMDMIFHG